MGIGNADNSKDANNIVVDDDDGELLRALTTISQTGLKYKWIDVWRDGWWMHGCVEGWMASWCIDECMGG